MPRYIMILILWYAMGGVKSHCARKDISMVLKLNTSQSIPRGLTRAFTGVKTFCEIYSANLIRCSEKLLLPDHRKILSLSELVEILPDKTHETVLVFARLYFTRMP
jgi:hypothetical protein